MRMSFLIMDKNKYFLVEPLRRNSLQNNPISVPQEIRGIINKKSVKKNHYLQAVSEIRVLILTSERTRQFMKLFFITFCKIRIPRFFAPQFLPNESFCVIK
jgi:hypothetical protein